MTARHAVYFAPEEDHPLWEAGSRWLGRRADEETSAEAPVDPLLAEPWRYGFHATLKPPMRLAEGLQPEAFLRAVQELAGRHRAFDMPALKVATLADFLALRPVEPLPAGHPLRNLADDCVAGLDVFRAPAAAEELQRRLQPHFSARQREHVQRYGYAHVLEDWRFHMTLTGPLGALPAELAEQWLLRARAHFRAALQAPLELRSLCVFTQARPGAPFVMKRRFGLASR